MGNPDPGGVPPAIGQSGILAYDLAPPGPWPPEGAVLWTPMRNVLRDGPQRLRQPTPYVPGPLADGHTRVVLWAGDCETPAGFGDYRDGQESYRVPDVFDVPREQRDRWEAAQEAFDAMQDEITALIAARQQAR